MITKTTAECSHPSEKIDYSWSRGNAGRCEDCGGVNDGGGWDDVLSRAAAVEVFLTLEKDSKELTPRLENFKRAAFYNRRYMELADAQYGFGYIDKLDMIVAGLLSVVESGSSEAFSG